jgi:hypothetical protein
MIPTIGNRNPITNYLYSQIISQLQFFNIKEKNIIKSLRLGPMRLMDHIFR